MGDGLSEGLSPARRRKAALDEPQGPNAQKGREAGEDVAAAGAVLGDESARNQRADDASYVHAHQLHRHCVEQPLPPHDLIGHGVGHGQLDGHDHPLAQGRQGHVPQVYMAREGQDAHGGGEYGG